MPAKLLPCPARAATFAWQAASVAGMDWPAVSTATQPLAKVTVAEPAATRLAPAGTAMPGVTLTIWLPVDIVTMPVIEVMLAWAKAAPVAAVRARARASCFIKKSSKVESILRVGV